MFSRLWKDDTGFIISVELILLATILVIGLVVGLASLRNQAVQEFVDVGQSVGSLSQGFCMSGVQKPGVAWTDGTCMVDQVDFCQSPQTPGEEPGGISVRMLPVGSPATPPGGEVASTHPGHQGVFVTTR